MTSPEDRLLAVNFIAEAVSNGAREIKACEVLEISQRTLHRWRSDKEPAQDQRPHAKRPEPKNKLSDHERKKIIEVANSTEFQSMPPSQIVPALADKGEYIASESTMYRVLKEKEMNKHRGAVKKAIKRAISTHCADGPNQVWMWDITYLPAYVKGLYLYLYLIIDLFSRKVVGWEVWEKESSEYASQVVRKAIMAENRTHDPQPLILHSDNGSPMKGATLLETLYSLGIVPSNSRPRVSNDNAYAESVFKTFKYRPGFPHKGFATIDDARSWVQKFSRWYNTQHHHSGLNFLTPNQRHDGLSDQIFAQRIAVYEAAKTMNPQRWSRSIRDWSIEDKVWLNPEKSQDKDLQIL
ncbi:IS3 family transposase [Alkalibacter saccharofermentans]|uniref:Putative transposase n=1 Tax=Alkalibacter saccharofermentans DSM 14828 TaxID=1120975 RepID=A0A1M4UYW2_9FIRM|nr:IS3 family transposase [Alkalibacter saccharofermentans]SHE61848.1 putative transposase [Alkalibacter saccharofermentans DSM 14828]